ncbi:hypothetical protein V8C86DRAFT_2837802 [Haematococcus lacustris]
MSAGKPGGLAGSSALLTDMLLSEVRLWLVASWLLLRRPRSGMVKGAPGGWLGGGPTGTRAAPCFKLVSMGGVGLGVFALVGLPMPVPFVESLPKNGDLLVAGGVMEGRAARGWAHACSNSSTMLCRCDPCPASSTSCLDACQIDVATNSATSFLPRLVTSAPLNHALSHCAGCTPSCNMPSCTRRNVPQAKAGAASFPLRGVESRRCH